MKKTLLIISILILFSSCDIIKKSSKSKEQTESNTTENSSSDSTTKTNSFTESFEIQPIDLNQPISFGGKSYTNTKIVYVKEKKEVNENKRDTVSKKAEQKTDILIKQKEKTEEFNTDFILYFFATIIVLGIFALILMFIYVNKNTKILTQFLEKQ